jgi:hypothetical protein
VLRHLEARAEQRPGGRRAEDHHYLRPNGRQLSRQPRAAGDDLGDGRRLVDPPFTLPAEPEVLHRVGQIRLRAIDAGLRECLVEQPTCRPDEDPAFLVLDVAGLLAHQHQLGSLRALAGYHPVGVLVEIASPALRERGDQTFQPAAFGHPTVRTCKLFHHDPVHTPSGIQTHNRPLRRTPHARNAQGLERMARL